MYKVHPQAYVKAWLKFKMINAGLKTGIKNKIKSQVSVQKQIHTLWFPCILPIMITIIMNYNFLL